jgi:Flp pilus assembly protein TadG
MNATGIGKHVALRDQDGVSLVLITVLLVVFVSFTALAVDISHLYSVRNELQNAADAGALAGAQVLYNNTGTVINTGANTIAKSVATENKSENSPVEVNWTSGNTGTDVERGHWSFGTGTTPGTFTPNDSTTVVDLWDFTTDELNSNTSFINAVRVKTRRQSTPAQSFFARIVGYSGFTLTAEAVAYIGFAGTLEPHDVDIPIAICKQALLATGEYTCSIARMLDSSGSSSSNTAGWTDFNQNSTPCSGGTNTSTLRTLIGAPACNFTGNPAPLVLGGNIALTNGVSNATLSDLYSCWVSRTGRTTPWTVTFPVIDCPSNVVGPTCAPVVGAVTASIIWMNDQGTPSWNTAPTAMTGMVAQPDGPGNWSSSDPSGQNRWNSFVSHFNLKDYLGNTAPYIQKSIYLLPDCAPHELAGHTGGQNFGILAKIPVLVN